MVGGAALPESAQAPRKPRGDGVRWGCLQMQPLEGLEMRPRWAIQVSWKSNTPPDVTGETRGCVAV